MSSKKNLTPIEACPLCNSDEITIYSKDPYDGYQGNNASWIVKCKLCGCMVKANSAEDALSVWNERNKKQLSPDEIVVCKELKERPELGMIAGYWVEIATHWHCEAEKNAAKVVELEKKLEETTAMLNAAISDLGHYKTCATCKHFNEEKPTFCAGDGCKNGDQWKWRFEK